MVELLLLIFGIWNCGVYLLHQIIHFKQIHMLFNVLSFALLGGALEKYIGSIRFLILWFISGTCGTLISTLTVEPPWNLGTGASQAVFGITALGLLVIWKKIDTSFSLKLIVAFALIPALLLDLVYAHHPKPGHIAGFIVGLAIGLYYLKKFKITHSTKKLTKVSS